MLAYAHRLDDDILLTEELRKGDFVELISGRAVGIKRKYLIESLNRLHPGWVTLRYATRDGKRDRRYELAWSGDYTGCTWKRLETDEAH